MITIEHVEIHLYNILHFSEESQQEFGSYDSNSVYLVRVPDPRSWIGNSSAYILWYFFTLRRWSVNFYVKIKYYIKYYYFMRISNTSIHFPVGVFFFEYFVL